MYIYVIKTLTYLHNKQEITEITFLERKFYSHIERKCPTDNHGVAN